MHSNFISKLTKSQGAPIKGSSRDPGFKSRENSLDSPPMSRASGRSRSSTRTDSMRSIQSNTSITTSATTVTTATTITAPSLPPSFPTSSSRSISPSFPSSLPPSLTKLRQVRRGRHCRSGSVGSICVDSIAPTIDQIVHSSNPNAPTRMDGDRRFHDVPNSNYPLPSDDEEMDRIQMQHYLLRFAFERDMIAPVHNLLRNGANVLDVGCAAGTWNLELATEYPNSQFYGIDIQPVFPQTVKPRNCHFQLCNILDGLPWPDGRFDFVHMRFMGFAFSETQWPMVVKELVRVTKSGGYVELFEGEMAPRRVGPQSAIVLKQINFAIQARNIDIHCPSQLGNLLDSQDLIGVNYDFSSMPISWGGRPGDCQKENFKLLMRSMKPWLAKSLGFTEEKYDEMTQVTLDECAQFKSFINYHFAYGMVPIRL